jgi:hypothetical protein
MAESGVPSRRDSGRPTRLLMHMQANHVYYRPRRSIDFESAPRRNHSNQTNVALTSRQDVPCRVVGGEAPAYPSLAISVLIRESRDPPATPSAACLSCCRPRISAFFVLKASRTHSYTPPCTIRAYYRYRQPYFCCYARLHRANRNGHTMCPSI